MLLSILVFLPLLFALILVAIPKAWVRWASLLLGGVHFLASLQLFSVFEPKSSQIQLVEKWPWLQDLGVNYFLGIDGISFWLVLLTSFLTPIVILASWTSIMQAHKMFHICLFVLQSAMIGSFLAFDSILFYVFFELSLIPMYFMVGIWGGTQRIYATLKFFIYTMVGSLLMLAALIYLIFQTDFQLGGLSASVLDFYRLNLPFDSGHFLSPQNLLFFVFCLGFAIKVPMFPFHTWLPDAHVQAPTGGSMILAGVMLKMGTYGFLRFVLPMFPDAVAHWSWLFMALGVVGIVYGALVAMVQLDMKKLVAYSSVSHMGYVVVGLFAFNIWGLQGGLFQMLAHGISTTALFFLVGAIYERTHVREIAQYGGLAPVAPWYTIVFLVVTFSSIAVPLTNGFIGEFLILFGVYQAVPALAYVSVLGVILGAAYMLWMVKKVFFGATGSVIEKNKTMPDLNIREWLGLAPLLLFIFWMGIFPNHFLNYSNASLSHLVENKANYQLELGSTPSPSAVKSADLGDSRGI